jgi:hypothetical protein
VNYDSWKLQDPDRLTPVDGEEGDVGNDLRRFLMILDSAGVGYGTRTDYDPPGTAVQVEHPDEDGGGFWVTEWAFNAAGRLTEISHYRGEPG